MPKKAVLRSIIIFIHQVNQHQAFMDQNNMTNDRKQQRGPSGEIIVEPKPQKKSKNSKPDCLGLLPDDLLVQIGKTVARLCGAREFVSLSRTCKRMNSLLTDEQVVEDVLERANDDMVKDICTEGGRLPLEYQSMDSWIELNTLERLALYDSLLEHGLFEQNYITFKKPFQRSEFIKANVKLISSIQTVLKKNPSASVVLDAHCGDSGLREDLSYIGYSFSKAYGENAAMHIMSGPNYGTPPAISADRILIRKWGALIQNDLLRRWFYPRIYAAPDDTSWVDVFFRIPSCPDELKDSQFFRYEMPSHPYFYSGFEVPPEHKYRHESTTDIHNVEQVAAHCVELAAMETTYS